jgi:hypothetical protein
MHKSFTKHQFCFHLTAPRLLLDDCDAWTLNASLTRLSSYRKCSKRRTLGHSAQATSLPPTEGTMKCSRIARGLRFGSDTESVADLSLRNSDWTEIEGEISNPSEVMIFRDGYVPLFTVLGLESELRLLDYLNGLGVTIDIGALSDRGFRFTKTNSNQDTTSRRNRQTQIQARSRPD